MIARELLASASIPKTSQAGEYGGALQLFRRGDDFMIVIGRNELMNSRVFGSEQALATMSIDRLENKAAPHILIGGYGMGFTLRAALQNLSDRAEITVAELIPDIIDWARGPMQNLTQNCIDDPRVTIAISDVRDVIANAAKNENSRYDAILLDVDNGPDGLTQADNDSLYSDKGLLAAKAALNKGGILAIWSAHEDHKFTKRITRCGFKVEEQMVRARDNGKGARHNIWFAQKI